MWTAVWPPYCSVLEPFVEPLPLHPAIHKDLLVYKSHQNVKGCRNNNVKKAQEQDTVYAGKSSDDGMRNKEQHEGKGKGCACNNHKKM